MAEHFTEKTNDLAQLLAQQIEAFEKEEAALKVSSFFFFFFFAHKLGQDSSVGSVPDL